LASRATSVTDGDRPSRFCQSHSLTTLAVRGVTLTTLLSLLLITRVKSLMVVLIIVPSIHCMYSRKRLLLVIFFLGLVEQILFIKIFLKPAEKYKYKYIYMLLLSNLIWERLTLTITHIFKDLFHHLSIHLKIHLIFIYHTTHLHTYINKILFFFNPTNLSPLSLSSPIHIELDRF
jgi:hypothetical protein